MKLITKDLEKRLRANAQRQPTKNNKPLVKFFHPVSSATWLISEIVDEDPNTKDVILFGLCDLGLGFPELGNVSLNELKSIRRFGLGVERDRYFSPTKTLLEYAEEASAEGHISA